MESLKYFIEFSNLMNKSETFIPYYRDIDGMLHFDGKAVNDAPKSILPNREIISKGLKNAKVFEIDEITKKMLMNTKPPTEGHLLRLPFKTIFIDIKATKDEVDFGGGINNIRGILATEYEDIDNTLSRLFRIAFIVDVEDDIPMPKSFEKVATVEEIFIEIVNDEIKFKTQSRPKLQSFIQQFIFNFILFLNQPEVEFINILRTPEENMKRMMRGKCMLPEVTTVVNLTGKLKEYATRLEEHSNRSPYSHRFWVRGHFRTLSADYYKMKKGMKVWVVPFIKGDGILLSKTYMLEKEES